MICQLQIRHGTPELFVRSQTQPGVAHAKTEIGMPEDSEIIFTISLSEPFGGFCYKLVAGIVLLSNLR
jgi:hypothetical protein